MWQRKAIDLSKGGPSWEGWKLAPWGKSGEMWLFGPDGTKYCASEIAAIREITLAADHFQVRTKELETLTAPGSVQFTASEAQTLAAAAAIVARRTPRQIARRISNVVELGKAAKSSSAK